MSPEEIKPAIIFNPTSNTFYWVTDTGHYTSDAKWPHGSFYSGADIPEIFKRFYALPPDTEALLGALEKKCSSAQARERHTRNTLNGLLKNLSRRTLEVERSSAEKSYKEAAANLAVSEEDPSNWVYYLAGWLARSTHRFTEDTDTTRIDEDTLPKKSATHGMNLAQRILHVGGRNNSQGYVEFGSIQAVEALIAQLLRDEDKPEENPEPTNGKEHRWNSEGERCVKCRDKDWMGGPCSVSDAEFIDSAHKRIKELEEACVESAQSDIPLKDELEATHRKLEDANAEIEHLNAKLTSLQSNYDASIQLGKSLEQQRNELRSEVTLNLMQTKDLVAYMIEGVVDGFEGKKLMIQWISGGKEKLKIGDGLYVLGSVNSTKLCDTCQTPNSCGGDGRCLEEYIKARITSGILPKTDTDVINKGCRYETELTSQGASKEPLLPEPFNSDTSLQIAYIKGLGDGATQVEEQLQALRRSVRTHLANRHAYSHKEFCEKLEDILL